MANRFFDTNYYKSSFVRSLDGPLKSLYSFIICDCDPSGIWNYDLAAAGLYIGFKISPQDFENQFINNGKAIHLGKMKFFFPDFIEHQYPKGLKVDNRAHKNIIENLKKIGALNSDLSLKEKGALKGLHRSTGLGLSLGNGLGIGLGEESRGAVFYDAEEVILGNEIELERICMTTGKTVDEGKQSLRKFHLHLADKEQYPKTRKAIFAGFEKWLMNEKNFKNGSNTKAVVGKTMDFD